ncbi:hypothetical protein [Hymenobacter terricola]|uniref:hypothetical protein n=1 Tax=Hymenobacter terricola TaxID=2819236 RepID=UPI001B3049C9|nr:hypothetical protein [Hymenobacter terricola]
MLLGACNGPSSHQPITGNHPAPPVADSLTASDTSAFTPGHAVPFVSPIKAGRVLGEQSPSPPASRTH